MVTVEVVPYNVVDPNAYASLLAQCPDATPFHSLEWMRIYERFSRKAEQFLVVAREGDALTAAMPVTVFERLLARAVFSSGFGIHGGPICRPNCPGIAARLVECFAKHFQGWRTVLSSVQDYTGQSGRLQQLGFEASATYTHTLTLPRRFEELEGRARQDVRRSARHGIRAARSKSVVEFRQWSKLCSANYLAHGRRPYSLALYRALEEQILETDTFRFHVATHGDRVVGGVVSVTALHNAYYWMGATDAHFRASAANDAVLGTVLSDCIDEAIGSFDFGPSPAGADGLVRFKEKWGASPRSYIQYVRANRVGRLGARLLRYRVIGEVRSLLQRFS
jgi:CelD/BcsL family acetyltransferase involved in cellulose biosynthesis